MKVTDIMGMDVSKNTLDCHLFVLQKSLPPVSNDGKGFKRIKRWLAAELKRKTEGLLVVMEYTGIYTYGIERFLQQQGIQYVKRPALDIKRSVGMVRGKSDKADARFIAKYGWMRKEELQPMSPLSDAELDLQQLMSHRDKLVADKASYQAKLKELVAQMGGKVNEKMAASMQYVMDVLTQEIKETEALIKELISSVSSLQTNYDLACSVTGIGFATAVHLLIATENFTRFDNVRKLICYCGVAPFEHSSGTSIRGKVRVSHLANKKLKSLLTMAAISAVQHDPELKAKYEQKQKEGKAKMSALNIIRAKLIERVFAVIKKQQAYKIRVAA
ncbi:MAG TPA: IS110 family transposase [Flavisolibacter sp.]|jgi:transposase|nr:IS110 family transposase [Flavisolibacter sp.]